MQIQKIRRYVVFVGVFLFVNGVLLTHVHAQAPKKPTLAVSSVGEGAIIWLMNLEGEDVRPLLAIDANPLPLGLEWSPDGRRLAFHTEVRKNIDVYVVNANGKNLKRLTEDAAEDSRPSWHPSGKTIAFTTNRDGNFEIYTMTDGGQALKNVTNDAVKDTDPAWSPDGRRMAFTSKRGRTLGDIYVMDANGENLRNLTKNRSANTHAAWSPDERKIAFISNRTGAANIYAMDAADGANQVPIACCRDPEWSPDGEKIAGATFGGGSRIFIRDADGKGPQLELPGVSNVSRAPAWFDPDFVTVFSVSPAEKQALTWGWLKKAARNEQ